MSNRITNKALSTDFRVIRLNTENRSFGAIKTLTIAGAIFLQLALFFLAYLKFIEYFQIYLVVYYLSSFITGLYIISGNKNTQSKVVWVFVSFIIPIFGSLFYFLSDERLFFRKSRIKYSLIFSRYNPIYYIEKKGNSKLSKYGKTTLSTKYTNSNLKNSSFKASTSIEDMENSLKQEYTTIKHKALLSDINYLKNIGNFGVYNFSSVKYYPSGILLFDEILKTINTAEKFVFIEYFIIADGILLKRFINILEQKVKQGVDVRIIYDDMVTHSVLKSSTIKEIREKGIKILPFNRLVPILSFGLNIRDHRKIVVIDGKIGFSGGANLADEYINEKRTHGYWKDVGTKISGPCVDNYTLAFLRQWEYLSQKEQDYGKYMNITNFQSTDISIKQDANRCLFLTDNNNNQKIISKNSTTVPFINFNDDISLEQNNLLKSNLNQTVIQFNMFNQNHDVRDIFLQQSIFAGETNKKITINQNCLNQQNINSQEDKNQFKTNVSLDEDIINNSVNSSVLQDNKEQINLNIEDLQNRTTVLNNQLCIEQNNNLYKHYNLNQNQTNVLINNLDNQTNISTNNDYSNQNMIVDTDSHSQNYDSIVIPYVDGLDYNQKHIGKSMYANVISNAREKIYIMTPYFIPGDTIWEMLKNKAMSGVDVRIILPGVPDKSYVYLISKDNAEKLIQSGVKIYYMNYSFVHAKVVLTEYCAIVGTINMDLRSFYQQFENAVYTNDEQCLTQINNDFENTFSHCVLMKKYKRPRALKRVVIALLRIFSPLM